MAETGLNLLVNEEGCGLKNGDLLYKYTDLGEYTDVDAKKMKTEKFEEKYRQKIVSLLKDNTIWFSKFEILNDPYEVTVTYNNYKTTAEKNASNGRDILNRSMVEILALTDSYNNLLMWSHYAESHKGYCIEFVVEDPSKIFKVQYIEKIPKGINTALIHTTDIKEREEICKFFLNKSKAWEYENEYRAINIDNWKIQKNGLSIELGHAIPLNEIGLKVNKIILGANCNKHLAKRIVKDCIDNNVPCVRAKLCSDKYDVEISKKDLKKEFKIG